ncbi:MAG TPA: hypothetical protein VFT22_19495 [Kofleriaceae bacterium]|nr:hypothetical protein [Kofleriaceae bacterium]
MLVSCTDADDDQLAPPGPSTSVAELPSELELVQDVPGFGGLFLDATGTPAIYLTPGAGAAPARQRLAGFLQTHQLPASALRVLEARFEWSQLELWLRDATAAALAVDGVSFVDNDEARNAITIGVSDPAVAPDVRAALASTGVPAEAVVIERAPAIVAMATLQNVVDRPVRAGVQINFPGFLCSVGFNATSGGVASFITASHCTSTQGGVESTPYFQPLQSVDPTTIAVEVADPVYVKGGGAGCPRNKLCRVSDSSRAAYVDPANEALGLIASTSAPNNGSLTITGSFSITSDDTSNSVVVGDTVNKVGRTTGWTQGRVSQKCVNTGVQGSRIVLLCQNFVDAGVGAGDSGSDVFAVTSGSNVRLEGVLWGGNSSGTLFVYSPLQNVIQDLGPLTTH